MPAPHGGPDRRAHHTHLLNMLRSFPSLPFPLSASYPIYLPSCAAVTPPSLELHVAHFSYDKACHCWFPARAPAVAAGAGAGAGVGARAASLGRYHLTSRAVIHPWAHTHTQRQRKRDTLDTMVAGVEKAKLFIDKLLTNMYASFFDCLHTYFTLSEQHIMQIYSRYSS